MARSTDSAHLPAEPIADTKVESVAEQEKPARDVHGIKVIAPFLFFQAKHG